MGLPRIIQGGMGAGVAGWRLARAVSLEGQLGVVSGIASEVIIAGRLREGDEGGLVRRALAAFPDRDVADRILEDDFAETFSSVWPGSSARRPTTLRASAGTTGSTGGCSGRPPKGGGVAKSASSTSWRSWLGGSPWPPPRSRSPGVLESVGVVPPQPSRILELAPPERAGFGCDVGLSPGAADARRAVPRSPHEAPRTPRVVNDDPWGSALPQGPGW